MPPRIGRSKHHAILFISLLLSVASPAFSLDVSWTSPVDGDMYASGDTILGQWTSAKEVVSPSFKLCLSDSTHTRRDGVATNGTTGDLESDILESCGRAVWPRVKKQADAYAISVKVPQMSTLRRGMYIQMEDDFGGTAFSNSFALTGRAAETNSTSMTSAQQTAPTSHKKVLPSASVADAPATWVSAPTTPPSASSSSTTRLHRSMISHPLDKQPTATLLSQGSPSNASPADLSASTRDVTAPTVALAVPLSLLGIVVLASVVLAVHHHRAILRTRLQERASATGSSGKNVNGDDPPTSFADGSFHCVPLSPHSPVSPSSIISSYLPQVTTVHQGSS
ncbi:hypothetical protein HYDPIDRAFT_32834 [Hydnomerulius pinastri MD-312]|uniref:Uncharacterized protein n=1 Tax=Hydnomerulius pinastri MD-312 TaxID=994086 RepID=A0A0C9W9Y2_9AGAM|nr:hypothetical protein HYDPIDRAFT_32834 [Hydnomerulius pinastri MD-312]